MRRGDGSPLPSAFRPGMGYDGRHGLVSNPGSSFFVTQCSRQLQGHQICFPAALRAWMRSRAPLQVKPHPKDWRLSPGIRQPEESLHCPAPAQQGWSHGRTPPRTVVSAQGRCGGLGDAQLLATVGGRGNDFGQALAGVGADGSTARVTAIAQANTQQQKPRHLWAHKTGCSYLFIP